jgi:uncharacterized membrane protein
LFLLLVGLNLLGLVILGVGLLVTVPMSGLSLAFLYRHLKPREDTAAEPVSGGAPSVSTP